METPRPYVQPTGFRLAALLILATAALAGSAYALWPEDPPPQVVA